MCHMKEETRKITIHLPASLLEKTMANNDKSMSETIREALAQYNHRRACQALLDLRGKVDFLLTYEELKELRD